jgi:uncharacterized protein (UPF0548 family)
MESALLNSLQEKLQLGEGLPCYHVAQSALAKILAGRRTPLRARIIIVWKLFLSKRV